MFSVFFRAARRTAMLFALFLSFGTLDARADTSLSVTAMGRDTGEAVVSALKTAVPKSVKVDPAFMNAILGSEILPNASHFVPSYKVLDSGGANSFVSIEANVDIASVQALYSVTPKTFGGKDGEGKVLVDFHGARIEALDNLALENYFSPVLDAVNESFKRRKFVVVQKTPDAAQAAQGGVEDSLSASVLNSAGKDADAVLALGIEAKLVTEQNENSHAEEMKVNLHALLVEVASGALVSDQIVSFIFPRTKKDTLFSEYNRLLQEFSRELVMTVLIETGQHYQGNQKRDFLVLDVRYPPSALLMSKLRAALEASKDVKSIVEYRVQRGSYKFSVQSALTREEFTKMLQALKPDGLDLRVEKSDSPDVVAIQIKGKAIQPSESRKGDAGDDSQ